MSLERRSSFDSNGVEGQQRQEAAGGGRTLEESEGRDGGTKQAQGAPDNPNDNHREASTSSNELVEGVERSGESVTRCKVRFVNTTPKTVDIIWLNHAGQKVLYRTLTPQTAFTLHTFKSHPWIFRDSLNPSERLVINKHRVKGDFFESEDFLRSIQSSSRFSPEERGALDNGQGTICVLIQLPVEDLRQLALKTVRRSLSRKEDCFCLPLLPQTIQFELAEMFL